MQLLRKGYQVTLVDQWGAGNSLSSSGGETRLIRCIYGTNPFYTSLAHRAYGLWLENEVHFERKILYPTGCLWFVDNEADDIVEKALPIIQREGLAFDKLTKEETSLKYPLINSTGLRYVVHEKKTGYLMAREGCQEVRKLFIKRGGNYLQDQATFKEKTSTLNLADHGDISGDLIIFACGPWLKEMFRDVMGEKLKITRQEVFYFGLPPDKAKHFEAMPTWIDHSPPNFYYGIPGGINRGFKIAFDRRGPAIDPSSQERNATRDEIERAREYIGRRFNHLNKAPLIESRVCQYSDTLDGNFVFDFLPGYNNVMLLGGGSGHGYKHGPALGELVANAIAGESRLIPELMLD